MGQKVFFFVIINDSRKIDFEALYGIILEPRQK